MPDGSARAWTPRVLREPDAAEYVGLSVTTFRQVVRPLVAPVLLSTGRIGWRREDLDRWVDGLPLATSAEAAPQPGVDPPAPAGDAASPEPTHARDPIAAALARLPPARRARRPAPAA